MKTFRKALATLVFFGLSGCAALFDFNLYDAVDTPPPLDKTFLASATPDQIDPLRGKTFYSQLEADDAALQALVGNLNPRISGGATAAEKILAAQEMISTLSYSTDAKIVAGNALSAILTTNMSAVTSSAASAQNFVKGLFAGLSAAQVTEAVQTGFIITMTMNSLGTLASNTSATFFGNENKGDWAQTGLAAAVCYALLFSAPGNNPAAVYSLITTNDPTTVLATFNSNLGTMLTEIGALVGNTPPAPTTFTSLPLLAAILPKQ